MEHVAKVQSLAQQLKDVGQMVDDVTIMAKILGSLPSKYNALKRAWDSVPEERQTVERLLERLIKEESHLVADEDANSALATVSSRGKKKTGKSNKEDTRDSSSRSDRECYYCGKKGHIARFCRKRKSEKVRKEPSSAKTSATNCAFVTTKDKTGLCSREIYERLLNLDMNEVWVTDSGASRHITFRRDWLTDFHPSSGDTVYLGDDGACDVQGSGVVQIEKFNGDNWESAVIEDVLYVPKLRKNLFSVGVITSKGFEVVFRN